MPLNTGQQLDVAAQDDVGRLRHDAVAQHLGHGLDVAVEGDRREVGGAGYGQPFEAQAQPCAEVALTTGTPNFSTLPHGSGDRR